MLIVATIFFAAAWIFYFVFKQHQCFKNLPPGPTRFPVIGSAIQLARLGGKGRNSPYHKFQILSQKYGPVVYFKIGILNQVVLEDIDIIKEICASELWVDRFYDDWLAERAFGKSLGILIVSGPVWKEMRRFSFRTLRDFGFGKLKTMDTTIQEELEELTQALSEKLDPVNGTVLSMKQYFSISVLNILWVMIAGTRFSHDNKDLHELLYLMDKGLRATAIGSLPMTLYTSFPVLKSFLPKLLNHGQERKAMFSGLHQFFRDLLHERRAEGIYKEEQRDFVDVFLREIGNHSHEDPDTNLFTDDQFVIVSMDLFMAGAETTSNTIEFALLYMILNPEVQKKVQAEIDAVIGSSRFPSITDKVKMPYTEATLLEVQRLACVVPILVRSPTQNTTIGEFTIPKGTIGLINIYGVHMNEKVFPDPSSFKPERFLDSENNVINAQTILPFGTGRRVCLGEVLAKTSLFVFFTTYLQRYTFEKSPNHTIPTAEPELGFTLAPQAYHALIKPRAMK